MTGFDVSSELIAQARKENAENFHVASYEKFALHPQTVGTDFDVVVCNFSLLGDRLEEILKASTALPYLPVIS